MQKLTIARALAKSFLADGQTADEIAARSRQCLGQSWAWLSPLIQRYLATTSGRPRARTGEIVDFILRDNSFRRACLRYPDLLAVKHWPVGGQPMLVLPAAAAWNLPKIESPAELADWLWISNGQLDWFADLKDFAGKRDQAALEHYYYRILEKNFGRVRLIEAPKAHLKRAQRQILQGILQCIPSHEAVHGFVKGRSIRTFAAPHAGKASVLRIDLRDFFLAFSGARIQAFFRTIGYPEAVADLLGGICTNATPNRVWMKATNAPDALELSEIRELYSRPHLPQGAPSSPALANFCFYRLDRRLTNCERYGPAGQNRDGHADFKAHLNGRIGFVESINAGKGQRLRKVFEQIGWP